MYLLGSKIQDIKKWNEYQKLCFQLQLNEYHRDFHFNIAFIIEKNNMDLYAERGWWYEFVVVPKRYKKVEEIKEKMQRVGFQIPITDNERLEKIKEEIEKNYGTSYDPLIYTGTTKKRMKEVRKKLVAWGKEDVIGQIPAILLEDNEIPEEYNQEVNEEYGYLKKNLIID